MKGLAICVEFTIFANHFMLLLSLPGLKSYMHDEGAQFFLLSPLSLSKAEK